MRVMYNQNLAESGGTVSGVLLDTRPVPRRSGGADGASTGLVGIETIAGVTVAAAAGREGKSPLLGYHGW